MKKSALILAPAVFALAGCGGPSCDGGKALDAVKAVSDSNDTILKSEFFYIASQTVYTKEGAEFKKITEKVKQDAEKLNKTLASCGQQSNYGVEIDNGTPSVSDGRRFYNDYDDYASREKIDGEAVCKPTFSSPMEPMKRIEGDQAFHKANITPAAYAFADDIKLWFAMRDKARVAHSEATKEKMKGFKLTLENIIMTFKDSTTGSVSCKATAVGHLDGLDKYDHRDITYNIEKTTSGKFVATVEGL